MTGSRLDVRTIGAFSVLVLAWGFNYLFVRVGLSDSPPLWLAFLRAAVGAVAVYLALGATGRLGGLTPRDRRDAVLIGLPTFGLFFGLWFVAAATVLPGEAAVIVYTFPLWVAVLSVPVLGHRVGVVRGLAVLLGFVGVVLVSSPWTSPHASLSAVPVAELLAGAFSWAMGTVLAQRRFSAAQIVESNSYQLMGGATLLLAASVVFEGSAVPHPSLALVAVVAWLGVVGTAIGYAIWFWLLRSYRAAEVSAYLFLVPVVALVGSVLLLGERLALVQVGGVGLVVASLAWVARSSDREEPFARQTRE